MSESDQMKYCKPLFFCKILARFLVTTLNPKINLYKISLCTIKYHCNFGKVTKESQVPNLHFLFSKSVTAGFLSVREANSPELIAIVGLTLCLDHRTKIFLIINSLFTDISNTGYLN